MLANPDRDTKEAAEALRTWAARNGGRLLQLDQDDVAARGAEGLDLVVAVGGDGTVLEALRAVVGTPAAVLGVAFGHLGYLAQIQPDDLLQVLDELHAGHHTRAALPALEAHLPDQAISSDAVAPEEPILALNDVVLSRRQGAGQALLEISIAEELITRLSLDALVLATPLGSTAYNLSAGGPIVSPDIELILLTPVAPAGFFDRTIVVAPADPVTLTVLERSAPVIVEADGQIVATLQPGDAMSVRSRNRQSSIIRLDSTNFYARVTHRLDLPVAPVLK